MRAFFFITFLLIAISARASSTEITALRLTSVELFRKLPKTTSLRGICADKTLFWLFDLKQTFGVTGHKIFLFFTPTSPRKDIWYHVAPVVIEDGKEIVLDRDLAKEPLPVPDWIERTARTSECTEITLKDSDLMPYLLRGENLPAETFRGKTSCYLLRAPAYVWYPKNISGFSISYRNEAHWPHLSLDPKQVFQACEAAHPDPRKCERFMEDRGFHRSCGLPCL